MASSRSAGLFAAIVLILGAAAAGVGWVWGGGDHFGPGDQQEGAREDEADGHAAPRSPDQAGSGEHGDAEPSRTKVVEVPLSGEGASDTELTNGVDQDRGALRVRGVVVDVRGAPVAGARIAVADQQLDGLPLRIGGLDDMMAEMGDEDATTGADGSFDVAIPKPGSFRLLVAHDDHPRATHRGDAEEDVEGVRVVLRDGAAIAGRVVGVPADALTEGDALVVYAQRVEGAIESATSGALFDLGGLMQGMGVPVGGKIDSVGDDGTFRVVGLDPDESYSVWAARVATEGESTRSAAVRCTASVDVRAGAHGVELVWREGLTVSLRVVDAETGQPLEQLDVSAGFVEEMKVLGISMPIPAVRPLKQKSFDGGVVRIDQLEVRDETRSVIAVEVRAEGRKPWIKHDLEAPRAGNVDLGVVRLERAAVVVARVFDSRSNEPIEGAAVQLVEVAEDETEPIEGGGRSISLSTNLSAGQGDGEEDFGVNIGEDAAMEGSTDAAGICRITAEFAGRARLEVQSDEHAEWRSETFDVPARGEIEIDAPQSLGGIVRVRVVDGHGEPSGRVIVRRTGPVDDTANERTDEQGVHVFEKLALGEHEFRVVDVDVDDAGPLRIGIEGILDAKGGESVTVRDDGVVHELTLAQPLRGHVVGFVTIDGEPFEGARVRFSSSNGSEESAQDVAIEFASSMLGGLVDLGNRDKTDTSGRFEIDRVAVGSYRLLVSHADLAMPDARQVQIVEGENRLDVPVRVATVRGRVVDASGVPVARAVVSALASDVDAIDLSERLGDAEQMVGEIFGGGGKKAGVRTDSDGRFELRGVRAGAALLVRAEARMHIDGNAQVDEVAAGSTTEGVEIVLAAAGRVSVVAKDVRGAMTAEVEWAGEAAGEQVPRSREALLKRGRTTIDGLRPGRWTVTIGGPGLSETALQPRTVHVVAGETARVEFDG